MTSALLLIDIQNDYFPGGAMELVGSAEAARNASSVLSTFRRKGWPIIHIQHLSIRPGATFFLPDTTGADIRESVRPTPGETIIRKHFPNSFRDTALLEHLHSMNIRKLVITGMMTHMCVDATVRAAFDLGFSSTVVRDACACKDLCFDNETIPAQQVHGAFLAALQGVYAGVTETAVFCTTIP